MNSNQFVAIDFETANSSRTSACSIGLVLVNGQKIDKTKYFLIRPEENIFDEFNTMIHGITAEDVENEPTFDKIWPEISDFIGKFPVVAHNASFDMSVLRNTLASYSIDFCPINYTCTLQISKKIWNELYCFKLSDVAEYIGIQFNHHDALEDATACAKIALAAMDEKGIKDILSFATSLNITPGMIFPGGYKPSSIRDRSSWANPKLVKPTADGFDSSHPLFGKIVVITLELKTMQRIQAAQRIVDVGGIFKDSISSKTNILVVGGGCRSLNDAKKATSKINKVKSLREKEFPIEVVFEEDLIKLLDWKP